MVVEESPGASPSTFFENYTETSEQGETVQLSSRLPPWFQGDIYMAGMGKFHFQESGFSVTGLQDGYALMTRVSIPGDGTATVWKKYLQSEAFKKANAAGKTVLSECCTPSSTDVTKSRLGRMMTLLPECTDNLNHIIVQYGRHLIATNGIAYFEEISASDLSTVKKYDSRKVFGSINFSAHPLADSDGTLWNIAIMFGATGGKLAIFKLPPLDPNNKESRLEEALKKYKTVASIPMPKLTVANVHHSFAMSENYIVTIEQPYWANIKKYLNNLITGTEATLMSTMEWVPEPGTGNRFYVLDKRTGKLLKTVYVSEDPFVVLHCGPCFERSYKSEQGIVTEVVVDLIAYKDDQVVFSILLEKLRERRRLECQKDGFYQRFLLPICDEESPSNIMGQNEVLSFGATYKVQEKSGVVVTTPGTFSRGGVAAQVINPKFNRRPYRYCYNPGGFNFDSGYYGRVVKFDLKTGKETEWVAGDSLVIGEPMFVPRPGASTSAEEDEDDGVLAVSVYYEEAKRNSFVFLEAKNMVEIDRVAFENALPPYMHPLFVPKNL